MTGSGEPEPIVVRSSRGRSGCLTLAALLFVAAGGWVLAELRSFAEHLSWPVWAVAALGGLAVAFFGASLYRFARKTISPDPVFVVDREGILDRSSIAGAGRISWEEIEDLAVRSYMGQRMLEIRVKDPEALAARQPALRRLLMRLYRRLGFGPVLVNETALRTPVEGLRASILRFLEEGSDPGSLPS